MRYAHDPHLRQGKAPHYERTQYSHILQARTSRCRSPCAPGQQHGAAHPAELLDGGPRPAPTHARLGALLRGHPVRDCFHRAHYFRVDDAAVVAGARGDGLRRGRRGPLRGLSAVPPLAVGDHAGGAVVAPGGPRHHFRLYRRDVHAAVCHRPGADPGAMDADRGVGRRHHGCCPEPGVDQSPAVAGCGGLPGIGLAHSAAVAEPMALREPGRGVAAVRGRGGLFSGRAHVRLQVAGAQRPLVWLPRALPHRDDCRRGGAHGGYLDGCGLGVYKS